MGHSSLAHLRAFPLDTVKLDMGFVQSMERSPIDRAIVQAVASIASVSGMTVVAEGVETEERLCARAMPVDEFEAWVLARRRAAVV